MYIVQTTPRWSANNRQALHSKSILYIDNEKREFVVGAASTDVQSGLATMCYLPGKDTPERECWYINMGAVGRDFFSTDAMVRAAP